MTAIAIASISMTCIAVASISNTSIAVASIVIFLIYETLTHYLCRPRPERWGAGVETQKNIRGEIGGWGRVPFNETYAPSLSTIYDGA